MCALTYFGNVFGADDEPAMGGRRGSASAPCAYHGGISSGLCWRTELHRLTLPQVLALQTGETSSPGAGREGG